MKCKHNLNRNPQKSLSFILFTILNIGQISSNPFYFIHKGRDYNYSSSCSYKYSTILSVKSQWKKTFKMLVLFGILLAFLPFHVASKSATTCHTIVTLVNTWQQEQDGKLTFDVPANVSNWKIVAIFDKPLITLNSWNGVLYDCENGTICTFTNAVNNQLIKPLRIKVSLVLKFWGFGV